jgi:CheY-like chemotaxis protein
MGDDHQRVHIRTLVVEDAKFQRDMLKTLFVGSNVANARTGNLGVTFDVTFAEGGRDALRLLVDEKKTFDLILVDVLMPGISGDQLLEKLAIPPTVAIVMISVAAGDPELLQRCLANGA